MFFGNNRGARQNFCSELDERLRNGLSKIQEDWLQNDILQLASSDEKETRPAMGLAGRWPSMRISRLLALESWVDTVWILADKMRKIAGAIVNISTELHGPIRDSPNPPKCWC